jgi:hypothetical protein
MSWAYKLTGRRSMRVVRRSRSAVLVATVMVMLTSISGQAARPQASRSADSDATVAFDIPAQPLVTALEAYNAVTGKDVFYDGAAGAGRRSAAVKGELTPERGLRTLLEGTDLIVVPSGPSAYTLLHAPEQAASEVAAARIALDDAYARYFAIIQANIRDTLCRNRQSWPDRKRLVIRLQIGPSGMVERAELAGSTGGSAGDANFVATLQSVVFDEPPPRAMPQPVMMVVFPQPRSVRASCETGSRNRGTR